LHALGGKLIGVQAVSLTHSYRLTFALAFSEEIGLIGDGVGSISRHWRTWACQCQPPILPEPFFADRSQAKKRLLTSLHERVERNDKGLYAIRADSAAEAAAFVCAALLEASELADDALSATLERIARSYESDAKREDDAAALRRERY